MSHVIYRFRTGDAAVCEHEVAVDDAGIDVGVLTVRPPAWATLAFHQCPNCPLNVNDNPLCPVAVRLPGVITIANKLRSYDHVTVEVESGGRRIIQETTAQRALSSLLGLLMATSGCPHSSYLRPMARFHLPLANEEETAYRAVSMYLLAQYFRHHDGNAADMTLSGLTRIYRELQIVNIALADRMRAASGEDSAVNAVVLLDLFAKGIPYIIEDSLAELKTPFGAYFSDPPGSATI
jgi:Domain of unknown function (DUF6901)